MSKNNTKLLKHSFLLVMLLFVLALTGCGAKISSTLNVDKEGKGDRKVTMSVSKNNESNITGGFNALENVLKQNLPSEFTMERINSEDGVNFVFTLSFNNIDEYNVKTATIIKTPSVATFIYGNSLFGESCSFEEADILEKLVTWAIDAVENAKIVTESRSNLYELAGTEITTPTGKDNFSQNINYNYNNVYSFEDIFVDTYLDIAQNTVSRIFTFNLKKDTLDKIGADKLDVYFKGFFKDITRTEVDDLVVYKTSPILVSKNENIMSTLSRKPQVYSFKQHPYSNILYTSYIFEDTFDLNKLFQGTGVENNIIYTLNIPSTLLPLGQNSESNGDFSNNIPDYFSSSNDLGNGRLEYKFSKYDTLDFSVQFYLEKKIQVEKVNMNVELKGNKANKTIEYVFNKTDIPVEDSVAVNDYFKTINKDILITDSNDKIIYKDNFVISDNSQENKSHYKNALTISYLSKAQVSKLTDKVLDFYDGASLNAVLGGMQPKEGFSYEIRVPKRYNILLSSFNGDVVEPSNFKLDANLNTYSFNAVGNIFEVKLILNDTQSILPIIIVITIIVVALVLVYYLLKRKKAKIKIETECESI